MCFWGVLSFVESTTEGDGELVTPTLRIAAYVREEFEKHALEADPIDLIKSCRAVSNKDNQAIEDISNRLEEEACHVVYGSNLIENAGSRDLDYTLKLCRLVFHGEAVDAASEPDRDPDYEKRLIHLKQGDEE